VITKELSLEEIDSRKEEDVTKSKDRESRRGSNDDL
jgi:hypothetical protein